MNKTNTMYIWTKEDSDLIDGPFHSIEEAISDVKRFAQEEGSLFRALIFACRPATPQDAEFFDSEECDINQENWYKDQWMPEDIVEQLFVG